MTSSPNETDALRDAIRDIARVTPHLAVLDAGMPDGIELLRLVKTHQPPVVAAVLTHSTEETTRRVCLRLGADYFLDKLQEFEKVREIVITLGNRWENGSAPPIAPY
jgi:DNA-binding response OmpR family regulator